MNGYEWKKNKLFIFPLIPMVLTISYIVIYLLRREMNVLLLTILLFFLFLFLSLAIGTLHCNILFYKGRYTVITILKKQQLDRLIEDLGLSRKKSIFLSITFCLGDNRIYIFQIDKPIYIMINYSKEYKNIRFQIDRKGIGVIERFEKTFEQSKLNPWVPFSIPK